MVRGSGGQRVSWVEIVDVSGHSRLKNLGATRPMNPLTLIQQAYCVLLLVLLPPIVAASNLPPANTYLADSNYAMAHGDPAQQDALPQSGPIDRSRSLGPGDIQ